MKPEPAPIPIAKPCPKSWEGMAGDDKRRFCGECRLHVHNLSAMSAREREDLLSRPGGPPCIAYELRPDGSMVTPSRWARLPFYRAGLSAAAALAAAFPMLFSSCATNRRTTMGAPMPLPASGGNSRLPGEIGPKSAAAASDGGQSAESRPLVKGKPAPPVMMLGTPPVDF